MPYSTVVAGTVITASWGNTNVRDQVVTPFASAAARTSAITAPVEGMVSYLTDTDTLEVYNGSSWVPAAYMSDWTDYSGTIAWTASSVNPAIGDGAIVARYARMGSVIVYKGRITMGSTTTYGTGAWSVSLPVNATETVEAGGATVTDASTSTNNIAATVRVSTSTTAVFHAVGGLIAATVPITWANGDVLRWTLIYEA